MDNFSKPEKEVPKFKKLLIDYYEDKDTTTIKTFMKEKCWRKYDKAGDWHR